MENNSLIEPLDAIMSPKSVAVIGASTTPGKVGHDIFVNILKGGFTGTLYPVNPTARSISSVRAYPRSRRCPTKLDLGIVILRQGGRCRPFRMPWPMGSRESSSSRPASGKWAPRAARSKTASCPSAGRPGCG